MDFFISTPGDRLAAAHEHFGSAGFSLGKIVLMLVIAGVFGFFIYMAVKKDDKDS